MSDSAFKRSINDIFNYSDENNDGLLDFGELKLFFRHSNPKSTLKLEMEDSYWNPIFNSFDSNGDKKVNWSEAWAKLARPSQRVKAIPKAPEVPKPLPPQPQP